MEKSQKIIVILGGGLVENPDGSFRTTTFDEIGDRSGILGDRLRVEAANYLWQDDPEQLIIASAGQGFFKDLGEHPHISAVNKQELIQLGVPTEKILEENQSNNTYQQLVNLQELLNKLNAAELVIITNQWHLPRVQAMVENNDHLRNYYAKFKYQLLPAEEIVISHEPDKWQAIVDRAYQSEAMSERLALEQQGLEQIKHGTYKHQ